MVPVQAPRAAARAPARRLAALEAGPLRARAAARALAALAPDPAARLLAAAVALAGEGEPALALALGDALLAPGEDLGYEHLAATYGAAVEAGLEEVRWLLVTAPPSRPYREPRDRADPALAHLTLGHKKTLARRHPDPDVLARLAAEGEPVVVRELLRNPRLTEELVVRIAARRPCRPETLRCLHAEARWGRRPAVVRALAQNPFAEPDLVAKLLPRLATRELAAIGADRSLHALVRALASRLVEGRAGGAEPPGAGTD